MPGDLIRETLAKRRSWAIYFAGKPPKNSQIVGGSSKERTQRAPKDHRHDSRSIESSAYGDDKSTTSRHARTRPPESVHQGNRRGRFDDEHDQAQYHQATPAPPTPAPTPIVPQATPTPPTPAPPTPAPAAPDHTQNDAAQTPAAGVEAAHGDAAQAHGADAHASQTGGSPVDIEQDDDQISAQWAMVPYESP